MYNAFVEIMFNQIKVIYNDIIDGCVEFICSCYDVLKVFNKMHTDKQYIHESH